MAFIATEPEQGAINEVRALYEADRERLGYVANYTKVFSHRPAVFRAWQALNGAIKANMDLRRYELVTLAAARALRSSYCALAHGQVLLKFYSEEQLSSIAHDDRDADLSPAETAMMAFAQQVTLRAHEITCEDINDLRAHGFLDAEILDIALTAAARNFFSRVLDALGTAPDPAYAALSPALREALVVGRAIAGSD